MINHKHFNRKLLLLQVVVLPTQRSPFIKVIGCKETKRLVRRKMRLLQFTMNYCGLGMIIMSSCAHKHGPSLLWTHTTERLIRNLHQAQNTWMISKSAQLIFFFPSHPTGICIATSASMCVYRNKCAFFSELKGKSIDLSLVAVVLVKTYVFIYS